MLSLLPYLLFVLPLLCVRRLAAAYFYPWLANMGTFGGNLNTDTINIAIFTSVAAPTTADSTFDTVTTHQLNSSTSTEVATGGGYTAGGAACTGTSYSQSGGTATLAATGPTWTGSGGGFSGRYFVAYDATAGSAGSRYCLIWWDYGSTFTVAASNTLQITFSSGIFTLTHG